MGRASVDALSWPFLLLDSKHVAPLLRSQKRVKEEAGLNSAGWRLLFSRINVASHRVAAR